MPAFNVHEAKTHFSKLLDQVLEGEEVLITRNGVPVAESRPCPMPALSAGGGPERPGLEPRGAPKQRVVATHD